MKGKFKSVSKILPILLVIVFIGIAVLTPVHQAQAALDETSFWYNPVDYIYRWATTDAKETVYEYSANIVIGIVHFFASSVLKLLEWLIHWAAWAVNIFLDPDIYKEVFNSPAIDIGWTICRDLCNLFFVLLLLGIAFATIFRIQAYSAKALLPKFILAIFLINFSKVIATIVIDFGQILMFQFVTWMGNFGPTAGGDDGAMSCLTAVSRQFVRDYPVDFTPSMEKMMGALFAALFVFVLMFIYLILAAFLLIRLVMLGLLVVLSPFAFMAVILPGTRSHSSKWWGSLFKYVLFGPIFVFFIYLSSEMGQHLMGAPGTPLTAGSYTPIPPSQLTEVGEGGNENIFKILVYFIKGGIVMGMLLASVFMTKSMGIIGAGALVGGTAGIGLMAGKAYRGARYGAGKAKGAASQVSKRVPAVGKAVDKVKGGIQGALKKGGLHGTALEHEGKEDKKKEAALEVLVKQYGDYDKVSVDGAKDMATMIGATDEQKAYYLKAKVTQGENLDDEDKKLLPPAKRALGRKSMDELVNKQVGLAIETDEGKKEIKKLTSSGKYTQKEAEEKVVRDKIGKHTEDGTWKKYNAGTWDKHYGDIKEEVNNDKELRNHYRTAGKDKQEHIEKGAKDDKNKKHSEWKDAVKNGTPDEAAQAKKNFNKARESAATVTGNLRSGYESIDYNEETEESESTDNKDESGNTEIDVDALKESVDKLSENFKNFSTDSKELFGKHANGVSGLDLKGQSQADIDALIEGLRSNTSAVRQEAGSMTILSQRIRTLSAKEPGLAKEFGIGDKGNEKGGASKGGGKKDDYDSSKDMSYG